MGKDLKVHEAVGLGRYGAIGSNARCCWCYPSNGCGVTGLLLYVELLQWGGGGAWWLILIGCYRIRQCVDGVLTNWLSYLVR